MKKTKKQGTRFRRVRPSDLSAPGLLGYKWDPQTELMNHMTYLSLTTAEQPPSSLV